MPCFVTCLLLIGALCFYFFSGMGTGEFSLFTQRAVVSGSYPLILDQKTEIQTKANLK
jgi:hypothetical protein